MRMEKKNYSEVHLEECKYKIKKIKMPEFTDAELESDSTIICKKYWKNCAS